jgi:hypothetical protein
MQKKAIIFVFMVFLLCYGSLQSAPEQIKNYSNSFFGVYEKNASVMGKVDGSVKLWSFLLRSYNLPIPTEQS